MTIHSKDSKLTDAQVGILAVPTLMLMTVALLIILNKKIRTSPGAYLSLALGTVHLYHHYTLIKLQNKH